LAPDPLTIRPRPVPFFDGAAIRLTPEFAERNKMISKIESDFGGIEARTDRSGISSSCPPAPDSEAEALSKGRSNEDSSGNRIGPGFRPTHAHVVPILYYFGMNF
jgi:hypothetical protein